MEIYELKDKIVEVLAAARIIVQKFGHTKKFAKHPVAFVIKQLENFKDAKLVEFLRRDSIGKMLGYKKTLSETTFSKLRERMEPEILQELQIWITSDLLKGKQLRLIAQDSTDVPAYSEKDKEAAWGHRTPSRKEQMLYNSGSEKEFFYGYKPHMIVDAETDMPIVLEIIPANTNAKGTFNLAGGVAVEGTLKGKLGSFSPDNCTAVGGSVGLAIGDYTASGGYNVTCAAATAVATVTVATAIATRTQAILDSAQQFVESVGGAVVDFCSEDTMVCIPLTIMPVGTSSPLSMTATYSNLTSGI